MLAELDYWCHERLGARAWTTFLEDVTAGAYRAESPTEADLQRCLTLQLEYADQQLGVVDASVVALLERLNESRVATLDQRHFGVVRPNHAPALEIVPS